MGTEETLKKYVRNKYRTWYCFADVFGENRTNFHRKISANIARLNKWLAPLDLEVELRSRKVSIDQK